ncbi:MAG TPA: preprotein translocase subunit SecE [Lentisphaeria bacterium]|nr:preprotein translocase subunit SecE [Lentisphaeria bacterium]|tara:strand:+ start:119 stop:310 length:192 start_codon:yes stop_codon:yes gene_type:complete
MKRIIPKIREYYGETVQEVKKCTWPTKDELIETTVVVIVGVIALSLFIALADRVMKLIIDSLM